MERPISPFCLPLINQFFNYTVSRKISNMKFNLFSVCGHSAQQFQ